MLGVVFSCLLWGSTVAMVVHIIVLTFKPHWILKWVFGFGQGAYAAVPNYGLLSTIPSDERLRHQLISNVPLAAFVVMSIVLAQVRPA